MILLSASNNNIVSFSLSIFTLFWYFLLFRNSNTSLNTDGEHRQLCLILVSCAFSSFNMQLPFALFDAFFFVNLRAFHSKSNLL